MPRSKTAPPATPSLPSPKSPSKSAGPADIPVAIIARRAADRLLARHVWVYRTDIETLLPADGSDDVPPGSLVAVQDHRGAPLGTALYSSSSMIALRLISPDARLTRPAFLNLIRERLQQSFRLRAQILENTTGTNACRLAFGEADALPGILIDRYGELVILQLLTQATHADDVRATVVAALREAFDTTSIASIVERPDPRICELEQLGPSPSEPLYTRAPEQSLRQTFFQLNGLRFLYDVDAGQKTGAFLDQRENYAAAASYAHGRALDICTYQGGFALHLARVCPQVIGVDASRAALEVAERNLIENQNQLLNNGQGVEWIEANAFDLLRDWSDTGERFDTIVLDPPAFAKSKRAMEGALRGYKEMNLRALKMLQPGGTLITCSCSHHVSLADFTAVITAAAVDAGRRVRLLETRGAALDHPAILTIPETQYLKCLICRVE
ncbi:MAG TPA: class I SAM-dependent rRNA methyltransferase [Acidobacteriaceae bacterium]|nr:class I SAM-dependent rRNA methyltransferase [Acidobacteriaceae bacterium]